MKWKLQVRLNGVAHPFVDLRTETDKPLAFQHSPDMADLARFRMMQAAPEMSSLVGQLATMTKYGDGPDELGDNDDAALCLNALIDQARNILKESAHEPS